MWNPLKYIYGSESFENSSKFALSESVSILANSLRQQSNSGEAQSIFRGGRIKGTVYEGHVYLSRLFVMVGNPYKPVFKGDFLEINGSAVLKGRFTMHWIGKTLFSIWIILTVSITLLVLLGNLSGGALGNLRALGLAIGVFVLFLLLGLAAVAWGKWLARNDKAHIMTFIQHSLSKTHE